MQISLNDFENLKTELETQFNKENWQKASLITAKMNFSGKIIEETKRKIQLLT